MARSESTYAIPGTYSWVCPVGVTSVSVVCVGGGGSSYTSGNQNGGFSRVTFGATVVQANGGTAGTGSSNGVGGAASGGDANFSGGNAYGGAGGAAGYAGNGGNGNVAGTGGSGGGGNSNSLGGGGGGVGLFGQGASGATTSTTVGGGGGSGGQTGQYGFAGSFGGGGGNGGGGNGGGGGLAYKNNISVTPGTSYTVIVGIGGRTTQANGAMNSKGGDGAVRIIWPGTTRTFPSTDVGTP